MLTYLIASLCIPLRLACNSFILIPCSSWQPTINCWTCGYHIKDIKALFQLRKHSFSTDIKTCTLGLLGDLDDYFGYKWVREWECRVVPIWTFESFVDPLPEDLQRFDLHFVYYMYTTQPKLKLAINLVNPLKIKLCGWFWIEVSYC